VCIGAVMLRFECYVFRGNVVECYVEKF